jgi:PLP dependent protein
LIAVSKTYGLDVIQAAYDAGIRHFGENRVEEAVDKIAQAQTRMPDAQWHMIGHIQSRKTADVAANCHYAHSVDRFKIARRLSESALEAGRVIDLLLEINISGEASKYGYPMADWSPDQQAFAALCADITAMNELGSIRLQGLMTMAPYADNPEEARPVFHQLRELRDALVEHLPHIPLPHLSMGMSGDFEVAVEEGATMVRVGTAIFGARNDLLGNTALSLIE